MRNLILVLGVWLLALTPLPAWTQQEGEQPQATERRRAYGHELMTPEERDAHRNAIRNMKTEEEREAFRRAHHESMQVRAKERGVELPEEPGQRGGGKGRGMGRGPDPDRPGKGMGRRGGER